MKAQELLLLGLALVGCNDRTTFSLKPYETVNKFSVQVPAQEADAVLDQLATSVGAELNRDPKPEQSAIPRDYIATIILGDCMIFAEGDRTGNLINLTVSLDRIKDKSCDENIVRVFKSAESTLRGKIALHSIRDDGGMTASPRPAHPTASTS